MTSRRFDPLRDLLQLQDRMNRLFEDSLTSPRMPSPSGSWAPAADVVENEEAFVIQVDLPGVAEDQVEIQVDGDRVVVRGERQPADKARPDSYHRMERSYGPFVRTFVLTTDVDPEHVAASLRDGLLRLELPKRPSRGGWRGRPERAG
ncbi:MAG TPA: Hsp20/alpha crystallin family protein [Vicinamibacteria bacterium]|nr:Hsp20/alpha crystallin family protein [Vicinamibacteria bacterium]